MKQDIKRLLCIVSSMDTGGAETFLMKIYRELDRREYQIDFCVTTSERGFYDDEIASLGGRVHRIPKKSENFLKYALELRKIVSNNEYKYVLRASTHSLVALDLLIAKFGGAKRLIFRSTNSNIIGGINKRFLHYLFCFLPKLVPTTKIAPSIEAGRFVFGGRAIKNNEILILNNGINIKKFSFEQQKREQVRKEMDLEDSFVVGHIGRFVDQKNHRFLIEIFDSIQQKKKNAKLLLIGTGELQRDIETQISQLGFMDKVYFLGIRSDIAPLLMAMDVMLFPSLYEGMPNVIIEAQATGLNCVVSDAVTKDCDITGLVKFLSLEVPSSEWADEIVSMSCNSRENIEKYFIERKYDIQSVVEEFKNAVFID